jgi:broad specificity phosphatase PhoE
MNTTIVLVRHGETAGNREGLFRGRKDFPLNQNGIAQADLLAQELTEWPLSAIYSSPLSRALDTARRVAEPHLLPVVQEPDLTNIDLGDWEGRLKSEIERDYPDLWHTWIHNPEDLRREGAETLAHVQERSFRVLERIVAANRKRMVAIVSHRAVLKPLLARCLGITEPHFWRIHLDTAAYSILEHLPDRGYMLTLLNQTKHLRDFIREMV